MMNEQEPLPSALPPLSRRAFLAQTTALAAAAILPAHATEATPREWID